MSSVWQSVADQLVAPADNKPFILDCLHYSQETSNLLFPIIQNILAKKVYHEKEIKEQDVLIFFKPVIVRGDHGQIS